MKEIIVKSQQELDNIDTNDDVVIKIEFGIILNPAVVCKHYKYNVVAMGNSNVVAMGNSNVVAWENSNVVAWENSNVEARENSIVEAWGNVQVAKCSDCAKIKTAGNARIVYNPKNVEDYMKFYDIKHTKTTALLYKAVHKKGDKYISDYNKGFEYVIGEKVKSILFDNSVYHKCGEGIHVSHLHWAIDFGKEWDDLAIIELKVKIKDILLPNCSNGKVRVPEAEVIREVPLEECGLYGKILMARRKK